MQVINKKLKKMNNDLSALENVKKTFKHTEIGLIPSDWQIKPLRKIIDRLEAGVSVNSTEDTSSAHENFILKTSAISNGLFYPHECKKIAPTEINRAKVNPKARTIIISRMNTPELVGECAYIGRNYPSLFLPDRLWMMSFFDDDKFESQWLNYLLNTHQYKILIKISATGTSGSMKNISKESLLSIIVPLPPLPEQKAIATALSDVDALINALNALIEKKRNIKQGVIQELLTGKRRLPGFDDPWTKHKIGTLTHCTAGGTPNTLISSYWGGNVKWMSSGELNMKKIFDVCGRITEEGLHNSSTKIIPEKCVLIGLAGQGKTRGTVAINYIQLCTNQSIAAIFPCNDIVPEYLYYNLDSRYDELRSLSTGEGGRGGLNLKIIKNIEILLPTKKEQFEITKMLLDIDNEIDMLISQCEKTKLLKQGMMQELLTGKTRLI